MVLYNVLLNLVQPTRKAANVLGVTTSITFPSNATVHY